MRLTQVYQSFLEVGFRPFFLGAAIFSLFSMSLWSGIYLFQLPIPFDVITPFEWHAHEMFYGYAFAVITGFLLTSVKTWTKMPTAHGASLLFLFLLWLGARVFFSFGSTYLWLAATFDILFALTLSTILTHRIIKAKQWKQLGIIAKLQLISFCNILFYLGAFGFLENGVTWGIFGGLYIVIALILTMGRRVIPFFIERAANDTTQLSNSRWLDLSSLMFFLAFAINELFFFDIILTAYLTLALFIINAVRLLRWHHPVIWRQGLLWSIYLSFWMITFGFALIALPYFTGFDVPKLLAIHAFTVGGIGMITIGMISRVSLAHTGRNVYQPPAAIKYAFIAMLCSAIVRVFLPLLDIWPYETLIGLSQIFWVIAFAIFIAVYAPILLKPKQ